MTQTTQNFDSRSAGLLYGALAPFRVSMRLAGSSDNPFLLELYADTRREEMAAWGWDAAAAQEFLAMQQRAQNSSYSAQYPDASHWILESGETAIGRLLLDEASREGIRLVDIALLTPWRGRGIGSAILDALKQVAIDHAVPLRLSVAHTNRAAHLYARHGFTPDGCDNIYLSMKWSPPRQ